jgi:hypothetical protein
LNDFPLGGTIVPGLLATKWIAAKNAAAKEDFRLVNWNQNFETVLDKIEDRIEDASENKKPSDKEVADMKQCFTAYQSAAKDYLKKIISANTQHPHSGKSWLVLHEGLFKIDALLLEMLRNDSNMKGPWPKLTGFIDKAIFKVTVEQPPANPALAKATLNDYNTEGFTRLAAKMQSAAGPAERAKAMLTGINTCLPQNRTLVDEMKIPANAIAQLVPLFENQINPATLNAQNVQNARATLDRIKAEWQKLLATLPTQATPFVKTFLALLQGLDQQMATAKPNRPAANVVGKTQ